MSRVKMPVQLRLLVLAAVMVCITATAYFSVANTALIILGYDTDPEEYEAAADLASWIVSYFDDKEDYIANEYGTATTVSKVLYWVSNDDYIHYIVFFVGHGNKEYDWWSGETHWYIVAYDGKVYDKDIYNAALQRDSTGVYILVVYACHSGDVIGGIYSSSGNPYGIPFAWLLRNDLSPDGYANPDGSNVVFIGCYGECPGLTEDANLDGLGDDMYNFFDSFFYSLSLGETVKQALDDASISAFHVPFDESAAYLGFEVCDGKLVVYGDGNVYLTFSSPGPDIGYCVGDVCIL